MAFPLSKLFRKPLVNRDITIVSGLPRSGTSMMMKMLASGGKEILTDNLRAADESNPKGYYEYQRVKDLKFGDLDWLPQAQGKVVKVISALLEYLPNQYPYRIIFMRRDMQEILSSQRQMLIRDGKTEENASDEKLAGLYGQHLREMAAWLDQQPNMETLFIDYNQVVNEPEPWISRINQFLGGNLDLASMRKVVDQDLYRERRNA